MFLPHHSRQMCQLYFLTPCEDQVSGVNEDGTPRQYVRHAVRSFKNILKTPTINPLFVVVKISG